VDEVGELGRRLTVRRARFRRNDAHEAQEALAAPHPDRLEVFRFLGVVEVLGGLEETPPSRAKTFSRWTKLPLLAGANADH
jgi:hypothetical protein